MIPIPPKSALAQDSLASVVPLRQRGPSDVAPAAVDLSDLNSPHTLAVLSVPPGATVLDVGCGPGIVARALAERGCRVWGIEVDPRKAALARAACVEVAEADLETTALATLFAGQRFDAILCLDVLEHLREPAVVLAELRSLLAVGGAMVISVPNVTHGALRLELLQGRFGYRPSGLLDHGHLRFFDGRALEAMVRTAGLSAETTLRVVKRLDQTEFEIDLDTVPAAVRQSLEQDPDALTYQFFVVARPLRDGQARGASLPERLRARVDQVTAELEKAGAYARSIEAELKAKEAQLEGASAQAERIAPLTAEIEKGGAYARRLEAEIANKDRWIHELQERERRIEADLASSRATAAASSAAADSAREQADHAAERAAALDGLAADLRRLLDDQVSYAGYLEGELQKRTGEAAVRDDEMTVLRAHVEKTERAIAERDQRLRASAEAVAELEAQLQQRLADLGASREDILRRTADVASLTLRTRELEQALEDQVAAADGCRQDAAALVSLIQQYRDRLSVVGTDSVAARAPWLYRVLRPIAIGLVGWRRSSPPR